MTTSSRNYRKLQAGDTCTVFYEDSASNPPLTATYQKFEPTGILVVTTPVGETDPELQTVHYIHEFAEVSEAPAQFPAGYDELVIVGSNVRVVFAYGPNGNEREVTGVVTGTNRSLKLFTLLTAGGQTLIVSNFLYAEIL